MSFLHLNKYKIVYRVVIVYIVVGLLSYKVGQMAHIGFEEGDYFGEIIKNK